eukprot:TRINITY_DN76_c0_g1_i7.p3 TRINITY_DN76_c0_g1~~TRINITY_DN76_c0_g1_i7.p3  ORF type:complete len:124 (+),score=21.79 TRINITY_DN76_c0_g1_i7:493-864(+)
MFSSKSNGSSCSLKLSFLPYFFHWTGLCILFLEVASMQTFYDELNNMKPNYTSYKPAIAQNLVAVLNRTWLLLRGVELLCFSASLARFLFVVLEISTYFRCSEDLDKHGRQSIVHFSIIKLSR